MQRFWGLLISGLLTVHAGYLKVQARPVVCIWGLGFNDRPGTVSRDGEASA